MEEQKPRSEMSGLGRPAYYLDGVSRPIIVPPCVRLDPPPTAPQPPDPGVLPPDRSAVVQPEAEQPSPTDRPVPSESYPATEPQSLIGAALPSGGILRQKPPRRRTSRIKRSLKPGLVVAAAALVGFGAWFGSSIIGSVDKVFHGNVFSDAHALISGDTLKESNGRINILLAGDSADDPGHQGADLTDSIMVISYDPTTKSGFLLSIPRDLWVYIPTMGYQKINAANDVTSFKATGLPSGGMGLLQQIVQNDLGIPIDYEALIDYSAFKDAVNTVDGITIDIQSPDPRGIYDAFTHLKLPNGEDELDGQEALDLARARGDDVAGDVSYGIPDSDFTRTAYQRQMLVALFKKALSVGVLSNPVKIADLFSGFSNNVQTDLSLGDVVSMLRVTDGLNLSHLQSEAYSYGTSGALLTGYDAPNGEDALIPSLGLNDFSALKQFYNQLTSTNPIIQEAPTVTLLNGSDVSALAAREKQLLEGQGFDVVSIDDASTEYPSTLIVNNAGSSKPAALTQLEKDIRGQVVTSTSVSTEAGEALNYNTNFVVVMGQDWDNTSATGQPVQN